MNVFVGIPTHDGRVETGTFKSVESEKHSLILMVNESSLLAYNCNQLLCMALNMRDKQNIKWFAMLHSDVVPEIFWIDKMIETAEVMGADLLSAVVPIKSSEGFTSTAIGDSKVNKRLTLEHIDQLPVIFGQKDIAGFFPNEETLPDNLLVNTGCMVYNLNHWTESVAFKTRDSIVLANGKAYAGVFSEDWNFSMHVSQTGGKVMATSAIKLHHVGKKKYSL